MYMFKFQMETSIIDSIKLRSVSISKICTYRAFPIDLITHWSLVALWNHSFNLIFIFDTCHNLYREESQTEGAYWCHETSGSGCGLAPSDSKLSSGPLLSRFMTPYQWRPCASNEFSIYLILSTLNLLMAWYFQYFGYQQAWY